MIDTLFLSNVVNNFDENTEPFYARYIGTFNDEQRYNVSGSRLKTYSLDATEFISFGSFWAAADWRMIAIKVVGEITLAVVGTDPALASITARIGCYGTSLFPGWLFLNAQNVTTSPTITANADGTVFEVMAITLAADAS